MRRALICVVVLAACGPTPRGRPAGGPDPGQPGEAARVSTDPVTLRGGDPVPDGPPPTLDDLDPALLGEITTERDAGPAVERAQAALDGGQWDRAVTAARAALAVDADEPRAVAVLARALGHKGWWESAHEALVQATAVAASRSAASAELWQLRGWASYRLGETGRALTELEASVKLRKDDALTWNLIGVVRLDRSEPLEAIKALENARSHAPESVGVATNLGSAYRRAASLASGAETDELLRKAEKSYLAALGTGLGRGHGFAAAYLGLGLLYLDAPAFPGLDDVERLRRAIEYLGEIEGKDVEAVTRADIGRYLTDARRELEQARREAERDRGR